MATDGPARQVYIWVSSCCGVYVKCDDLKQYAIQIKELDSLPQVRLPFLGKNCCMQYDNYSILAIQIAYMYV